MGIKHGTDEVVEEVSSINGGKESAVSNSVLPGHRPFPQRTSTAVCSNVGILLGSEGFLERLLLLSQSKK